MEKNNLKYRVALLIKGMPVTVTLTLDSIDDAAAVDKWLEDEKDNSIYAADGGPNDIEL